MTSQKQINANRRNALLSTGPRTEEGKGVSRLSAMSLPPKLSLWVWNPAPCDGEEPFDAVDSLEWTTLIG